MPLTLLVDTVTSDMIALSIESMDEETGKSVEIVFVIKEDEEGFEFTLTGSYGREMYELLRGRAPMKIYDKGWRHEWRTS